MDAVAKKASTRRTRPQQGTVTAEARQLAEAQQTTKVLSTILEVVSDVLGGQVRRLIAPCRWSDQLVIDETCNDKIVPFLTSDDKSLPILVTLMIAMITHVMTKASQSW